MNVPNLVDPSLLLRAPADRQVGGSGQSLAAKRSDLQKAAREFESIFLYQVISAMRATVHNGGLIEQGAGEKVFAGMLDEEWAKKLAGRGGPSSLSELLYRQLSRQMGLDQAEAPAVPPAAAPVAGAAAAPLRTEE